MSDSNHDIEYLQHCKVLIEEKLNWRPSEEWRNYEFTELSEKIFEDTNVSLSITTLKRVFGKIKYESLPSSTTLNTLANYIGFSSWMDFKSKTLYTDEVLLNPVIKQSGPINKKWLMASAIIAICVLVVISFLSGKSSPAVKNADSIVFKSNPLAEGLPNSVVFNVDLKNNNPDNIVIQQSWDSTKTIHLKPGQTEATGIYYFPGYFRAKLLLNGKIVKEHDLYIRSDEWMATIDHKPIPTYLKDDELIFDNRMDVSETLLSSIRKTSIPTYITYHLVKPFTGLKSDNFLLETSIKNTYAEGSAVCQTAKLFVLCSNGAFIIPFTIPGCISDINLKVNDHYFEGKSNDLSAFGTKLSNWTPVKLEVRNKKMKIFLNDQLIREETYLEDAGEIVGLRFSFLGAGAVKYVKLTDEGGNSVYKEEFEKK